MTRIRMRYRYRALRTALQALLIRERRRTLESTPTYIFFSFLFDLDSAFDLDWTFVSSHLFQ